MMDHYGITTFGHGGSNRGWQAMLALEPVTRDGIVLLTNGPNGHEVLRPLFAEWAKVVSAKEARLRAADEGGQ